MRDYSLPMNDILSLLDVDGLHDAPVISGLTLDSRQIKPGDLFVALAGASSHGLEFLDQAVQRGCVGVLWENGVAAAAGSLLDRADLPRAEIENLSDRLGSLADRFYQQPSSDMQIIGVTGTNGKSSCVHLIGQAVNELGAVCGTLGTLGWGLANDQQTSTHTTPDAIEVQARLAAMRDAGADTVAMEVSSHALQQGRVNGVAFDLAILTNLTHDHLDYHGDMAAYGRAKSRLFSSPGLRFAILNQDDDLGRRLLSELDECIETTCLETTCLETISYGINNGQFYARNITQTDRGVQFTLHTPRGEAKVRASLLGRFNIENLLAVAATLAALGWTVPEISDVFAKLRPAPGRMNLLGGHLQPLVVVDYAHTPDALKQSLQAVRAHCSGLVYCVFGCGGDRDRSKRSLMAAVAEQLADQVIVTDDNPRGEDGNFIVADIVAGFKKPDAIAILRDRAVAINQAIANAGDQDLVLIAGKGHEDYQEIEGVRRPFDDRQVAAAALQARP